MCLFLFFLLFFFFLFLFEVDGSSLPRCGFTPGSGTWGYFCSCYSRSVYLKQIFGLPEHMLPLSSKQRMGLVGKWGGWWQPPEPLGVPGGLQDPTEGGPTAVWAEVGQNKQKPH